MTFELFAGSINIRRLTAETYIDGERFSYYQTVNLTIVPETTTATLTAVAIGLLMWRRRAVA